MAERTNDNETIGNRGVALRLLGALNRAIGAIERCIVGGGVLLMAAVMSMHVLGRILFNRGIPGTTEITEMLIIVITFVGVGYAVRHARHISMSAVYDQLSGTARKTLLVIISVCTGVLMFYFAWLSADYAVDIYNRGRVSSTLRLPMWIVIATLPFGFTLAGIQYFLTTIRNLTSDELYRSFNEKEEYSEVPGEDAGVDSSNRADENA